MSIDPYATQEESEALLKPDTRTPAQKYIEAELDKRGSLEMCVDHYAVLYELACELAEQAQKQGCAYCNHPLYAGTKCKNCGRVTEQERHVLQAEGEHPAPCARFCEANAFKIEIRNLKKRLEQSTEQEPVAWPCVIAEADFEKNTIMLEMKCSNYKVSAGLHWLHTSQPQEAAPRKPLTYGEIRKWWANENGLEDCSMAKLDDFTQVVRAVEGKHGITGEKE